MSNVVDFDPERQRTPKDSIWEMRRNKNLSSDTIEIWNQRGKVILWERTYYYEQSAWCVIKAKKGKYYLCEYTCPYAKILIKEWIHEDFVDLMLLRLN